MLLVRSLLLVVYLPFLTSSSASSSGAEFEEDFIHRWDPLVVISLQLGQLSWLQWWSWWSSMAHGGVWGRNHPQVRIRQKRWAPLTRRCWLTLLGQLRHKYHHHPYQGWLHLQYCQFNKIKILDRPIKFVKICLQNLSNLKHHTDDSTYGKCDTCCVPPWYNTYNWQKIADIY